IDNVVVQRIAPETTLESTVQFSGDSADQDVFNQLFQAPAGGNWQVTDGRYIGENSVDLVNLSIDPAYILELNTSLQTGAQGGFVFDYYGPQDFKFVTVSIETGQVLIGHSTAKAGWVVNAAWSNAALNATEGYSLGATLMGNTVSVTVNGQGVLSFAFNALVTDGQFGLLARNGEVSFDTFTVRTDDPAFINSSPALPAISVSDASATEGDNGSKAVTVTFTLSAPADGPVSVDYSTLGGTASAGDDYLFATGTLIFAPGDISKQVTVSVFGDLRVEPDETFSVQLSNPVGATIVDGAGTIAIVNDDVAIGPILPSLSVSDAKIIEGDKTNKTKVNVTVTLSQASATPVTVHLATENGTAVSGSDYVSANTIITFAAGETTKQYTMIVNGDKVGEADEWFGVRLSDVTGATIADDFGKVTILNDDGAAMTAATAATGDDAVDALTDEMLAAIVDGAIERWNETMFLDESMVAALHEVNFQIADFVGLTLGLTDRNTIYIDANAAGYGWFVDQTPWDDAEFGQAESIAAGRMDLLTVVMHELGHVLGYEDIATSADMLMSEELSAGVRYLSTDLPVATMPATPMSTLLQFRAPSNGIPSGWVFENGSISDNNDTEGWWERIRGRVMGHKQHDALPALIRIRELASVGSMENGYDNGGNGSAMINLAIIDPESNDGALGASLGQGQKPWVSEFL
ncbi:MAG: Calx-beta domain-containing protein, partial [bacterium]